MYDIGPWEGPAWCFRLSSGSPVAQDDSAHDQQPFVGFVMGQWSSSVIIGVPVAGVKPSEEVSNGGALSEAERGL